MSYPSSEQAAICLSLACWARASGLTRSEANQLQALLLNEALPATVDQAWSQLERVSTAIRRRRAEPLS